jgi:hypothetical protein
VVDRTEDTMPATETVLGDVCRRLVGLRSCSILFVRVVECNKPIRHC